MNLILITYDLHKDGRDYKRAHKAIEELGEFKKPTESTYVVKTNLETHDVSQKIRHGFDENDCFFVVKVYRGGSGTVQDPEFWGWFDFS